MFGTFLCALPGGLCLNARCFISASGGLSCGRCGSGCPRSFSRAGREATRCASFRSYHGLSTGWASPVSEVGADHFPRKPDILLRLTGVSP